MKPKTLTKKCGQGVFFIFWLEPLILGRSESNNQKFNRVISIVKWVILWPRWQSRTNFLIFSLHFLRLGIWLLILCLLGNNELYCMDAGTVLKLDLNTRHKIFSKTKIW